MKQQSRETANMSISFSADFLDTFPMASFCVCVWYRFAVNQHQAKVLITLTMHVGDTWHQRKSHKMSACCSLGSQSVRVKKPCVVGSTLRASQWKLTAARRESLYFAFERRHENMSTQIHGPCP